MAGLGRKFLLMRLLTLC